MKGLTPCRWRESRADGTMQCHSAKFIVPPNHVEAVFCETCVYHDHEAVLSARPYVTLGAGAQRIAIATLYTPEIAEYGQLAAEVVADYARWHGYAAIIASARLDEARPPSWSKLLLVERHLAANPGCEWILWIDADAVITKPLRSLEHLIDPDTDFLVAEDIAPSPINLGVFLARNCTAVRDMLRRAYTKTHYIHHPWWEQPAVAEAMHESHGTLRVRIVPRQRFNTFAYEYREEDFIIHFAGCAHEVKRDGVRKAAGAALEQMRALMPAPAHASSTCLGAFFEKLPKFVVADQACGVISAVDASFFIGFQFLASCLLGKVNLAVYDLGLHEQNLRWCAEHGIRVLPCPELLIPKHVHYWQSWNKPLYFRHSPFAHTLWIDSDCLVVGDLNPLFDLLKRQPLIVAHPWGADYPNPNSPRLYELLTVPLRLPAHKTINAGVLGFSRDRSHLDLLDAWQWLIGQAGARAEIMNLITWVDEGALTWAIQAAGKNDLIQMDRRGWNRFYATPFPTPAAFLRDITFHPHDTILHYAARPKFWSAWTDVDFSARAAHV